MKKNSSKPWYVLIVCCGLAASSIGISINSSGVFYTSVSQSLGIMRGTFAMHMTIFSFVTAIASLIVPRLMNKFHYKLILGVSVLIAVISTAMMSYSKSIYMFYFLGAIRGFSTGLFSIVPLTIIVNGWFKKHHGLATSIVFGFSGLAGAICSPVLAKCIDLFGWNIGYIIKAGIILVLCLPAIIYPFEVSAKDEGALPLGYGKNEDINKETYENRDFNFVTIIFICFCIFALINTTITGIT
ncbi:MFS transporter [Clostridioides difficile]